MIDKLSKSLGNVGKGIGKFIEGVLDGVVRGIQAFSKVSPSALVKAAFVIITWWSINGIVYTTKDFSELNWQCFRLFSLYHVLLATTAVFLGNFVVRWLWVRLD